MKTTNMLSLYSEEELEEIKRLADISEKENILNIIYNLSEIENDIKWSSQKTIMFQTGIIKLCMTAPSGYNGTDLEKRMQLLEEKLNNFKLPKNVNPEQIVGVDIKATLTKKESKSVIEEEQPKVSIINGNTSEKWNKILEILKKDGKIRLYTSLINTQINEICDDILEI